MKLIRDGFGFLCFVKLLATSLRTQNLSHLSRVGRRRSSPDTGYADDGVVSYKYWKHIETQHEGHHISLLCVHLAVFALMEQQ